MSATPIDIDDDTLRAIAAEFFCQDDGAAGDARATSLLALERDASRLPPLREIVSRIGSGEIAADSLPDAQNVDLAHLAASPELGVEGRASAGAFTLTGDALVSLAMANGYADLINGEARVAFGLRGCVLADGGASSAVGSSVRLKEAPVDHVSLRCVIGVWRPQTGELVAFAGSTAPHLLYMHAHRAWRFRLDPGLDEAFGGAPLMCGLMPQGLHWLRAGPHLAGSPLRRQPAALVQTTAVPVMRAQTALAYGVSEPWDPVDWRADMRAAATTPWIGAGIHASVAGGALAFASSIGQTLPRGEAWTKFRTAMGIVEAGEGAATHAEDETTHYPYLLTTGREARLHVSAGGRDDMRRALRRMRFGGIGPGVTQLRAMLGVTTPGGGFDADTMMALLRWQARKPDIIRDGALTPRQAREAGLTAWR